MFFHIGDRQRAWIAKRVSPFDDHYNKTLNSNILQ